MKKLNFFGKIVAVTAILLGAFLMPVPAQAQSANEYWISTKATGNMYPNGGTLDNSLDGSTAANFDSNMGSLPPNCTIHILAGTYQTLGAETWNIKSGQRILGSGMTTTTLRLITNNLREDWVLGDLSTGGQDVDYGAEIKDLTCDCNYQSGQQTLNGISMWGTNILVQRVKVIHAAYYNTAINTEAWGIAVSRGSGNEIEDCEVSEYAGGADNNISAITMGGTGGALLNNRVYLVTGEGGDFALGATGDGMLIKGNYVYGASVGVYSDTGGSTNIIITDNTFKNVRDGVFYADDGQVRQNFNISDNTIMLSTNAPFGPANFKTGIGFGHNSTNVTIMGNIVGWDGEPNPDDVGADYFLCLDAPGDQGIVVANNRVDSRLLNSDRGTNGISPGNGYTAHDNYDFSGNFLPNLTQRPPNTNSFFILPPDAIVQIWGAGSVSVGGTFTPQLWVYGWNCSGNANATIYRPLPLPDEFWDGRTTFVSCFKLLTTNAGSYVFNIGMNYLLTNDVSGGSPQQTVSFTAPTGTNITTISATNTIPTASVDYLQTYIWTAHQVQPGNYTILSGKVTAQ